MNWVVENKYDTTKAAISISKENEIQFSNKTKREAAKNEKEKLLKGFNKRSNLG